MWLATLLGAWLAATTAGADTQGARVSGVVTIELAESTALEEPPRAVLGPGLVYVPNVGASMACGPRSIAEEALRGQVLEVEAALGIDVELAAILTTELTGCDSLYYVPVANDVSGIGYANTDRDERFDLSPDTALQGIAFLNDMPYWEDYPEEFRTAFLHEVGHRWGARILATKDDHDLQLTGREGGHWSYFLNSEGSPLEGNRFDRADPLLTNTPKVRVAYSSLDLYLMGAIHADEVGPLQLLENPEAPGVDCRGYTVTAASPPQDCEPKRLAGSWLEFDIDDVIAREGPRMPSAEEAPRHYSFATFVFGTSGSSWSVESCESTAATINERVAEFNTATGGRLYLDNVAADGLSCERLIAATARPTEPRLASSCSSTRGTTGSGNGHLLLVASLIAVVSARSRARGARDGYWRTRMQRRVPLGSA